MLDLDGLKNKALGKAASFIDHQFPGMGVKAKVLGEKLQSVAGVNDLLMDGFTTPEGFHYAGMTKAEISGHYKNLHALGVQQKEYYIVRFKPYRNNAVKDIPFIENELSGWLATDVSWPMISNETETKRVGCFTMSYTTGRAPTEFTITMIETAENLVLRTLMLTRNAMFNSDGTFNLPSEYCFWVEVYLYGRHEGMAYPKSGLRTLCFISQASLDMSASDGGALTVPITFTTARHFMKE